MNAIPLEHGLALASVLFALGLVGLMVRRNILFVLMSLEVMMNAAALAFVVAGSRWGQPDGQVMFILVLSLAAAEASIGLAILPHFMGSRDPLLVPVLPEESIQREYWMSTRRELHRSVRLRVVWDFLLELCQREREVLLGPSATPPP